MHPAEEILLQLSGGGQDVPTLASMVERAAQGWLESTKTLREAQHALALHDAAAGELRSDVGRTIEDLRAASGATRGKVADALEERLRRNPSGAVTIEALARQAALERARLSTIVTRREEYLVVQCDTPEAGQRALAGLQKTAANLSPRPAGIIFLPIGVSLSSVTRAYLDEMLRRLDEK